MVRKIGFFLMVGILIGAGIGLFAFAGGQNQDYTPAEPVAEEAIAGDASDDIEAGAESEEASPVVQRVAAPVLDAPAPSFTLQDLDGESVSLEDYRGQVVLLNFWATWCTTCITEFPVIQAEYTRLEDQGFVVLAVNYDEPQSQVQAYVEEMSLTMPVLLDPGANTVSQYRVRGFPTSFIIDADGVIRIIHIGLLTEDNLKQYLEEVGLSA